MPTQLTELETLEVSLVKRGANKKRYALTKSEMDMQDLTAAILATPGETPEEVEKVMKADLSKEAQAVVGDALKMLDAVKEEMSRDLLNAIGDALGVGGEKKPEETKAEEDEELEEEKEKALDGEEEGEKVEEEKSVEKSADPRIEAMFKENAELKAQIQKAADEASLKEHIAKAEKELNCVPSATPSDVGTILKKLDGFDKDLSKQVESIFAASHAIAKNSGLVEPIGSSQPGITTTASGAEGEIEALAKSRVAKTGEQYETAYLTVLRSHPELYTKSLGEV
mgnify:CR=1 FL=1|tara:strand:+ start:4280 stop:5128 length:849 start_codon:yes stop_codon:yes gene_type:complete